MSAAGTSVNTANQTSDILWYPMNNKFIMCYLCVNTIATVSCAVNTCITWGDVITQRDNYMNQGDRENIALSHILLL